LEPLVARGHLRHGTVDAHTPTPGGTCTRYQTTPRGWRSRG
jgi:hypothetical protein